MPWFSYLPVVLIVPVLVLVIVALAPTTWMPSLYQPEVLIEPELLIVV